MHSDETDEDNRDRDEFSSEDESFNVGTTDVPPASSPIVQKVAANETSQFL